jgi:hypothetical protein
VSIAVGLALIALAGSALAAVGWIGLRLAGADPGLARRLAGPREVTVGTLITGSTLPRRPVRVTGRIRCPDPLETPDGDRLVAYHRDVDVLYPSGWRRVERRRETRSFELWDHGGALEIDPALAAEPLIAIPSVWRGPASELEGPLADAARGLAHAHGVPRSARSVIRTVSVTDRLLVVAQPHATGESVRLEPPAGGYLISTLALDDAMRLLGGRPRRLVVGSIVGLVAGAAITIGAALGALVTVLIGG